MNELLVVPHLGLGDALICNGLVRELAKSHTWLGWPVKPHNRETLFSLWADLANLQLVTVEGDLGMLDLARTTESGGGATLRLGLFRPAELTEDWDVQFYRQAGMEPDLRWKNWKIGKLPKQIQPPTGHYQLIHEDPDREFRLERHRLPTGVKRLVVDRRSANLLSWVTVIQQATAIHGLDSSVVILADFLKLKAKKRFIHLYARPGARPPSAWRHKWELL